MQSRPRNGRKNHRGVKAQVVRGRGSGFEEEGNEHGPRAESWWLSACEEIAFVGAMGSSGSSPNPSLPPKIPPRPPLANGRGGNWNRPLWQTGGGKLTGNRPPLAKGGWGDLVVRRGHIRADASRPTTGCPGDSFAGSQWSVVSRQRSGGRRSGLARRGGQSPPWR